MHPLNNSLPLRVGSGVSVFQAAVRRQRADDGSGSIPTPLRRRQVRTGRANVQILDRVEVDYYGAPCSLKSLATVTTPDAQVRAPRVSAHVAEPWGGLGRWVLQAAGVKMCLDPAAVTLEGEPG